MIILLSTITVLWLYWPSSLYMLVYIFVDLYRTWLHKDWSQSIVENVIQQQAVWVYTEGRVGVQRVFSDTSCNQGANFPSRWSQRLLRGGSHVVPERAGERKEGLLHKELLYPEKGTGYRETMQLDLSIRRHPSVRDMIVFKYWYIYRWEGLV